MPCVRVTKSQELNEVRVLIVIVFRVCLDEPIIRALNDAWYTEMMDTDLNGNMTKTRAPRARPVDRVPELKFSLEDRCDYRSRVRRARAIRAR